MSLCVSYVKPKKQKTPHTAQSKSINTRITNHQRSTDMCVNVSCNYFYLFLILIPHTTQKNINKNCQTKSTTKNACTLFI